MLFVRVLEGNYCSNLKIANMEYLNQTATLESVWSKSVLFVRVLAGNYCSNLKIANMEYLDQTATLESADLSLCCLSVFWQATTVRT